MGHHGCRGTTAAAMVNRVLSIDVCVVHDLYVPYTFPPQYDCLLARAIYPSCSLLEKRVEGSSLGRLQFSEQVQ